MPKPVEETRLQILNAAQARFITYGFKKTNVNEIAADCDMSPANLYRFFDSKGEMGAAVVRRHIDHTQWLIDEITKLDLSAQEKLNHFCQKILEYNFNIFSNQIHLFELMEYISKKRIELPKEHIALKQACLKMILQQGQKEGTVKKGNLEQLTLVLFQALRSFLLPHSFILGGPPLPKLKQQASDLISLLFSGLKG